MSQSKIVLQNAKAQLEAQKKQEYDKAYSVRVSELRSAMDAYTLEKNKEYTDSVARLKAAYNEAVAEKKREMDEAIAARKATVESEACIYAAERAKTMDELIASVQLLIDKAEG